MWQMIAKAQRRAKLTLLGAALIKFATGLAAIWGTCNIYFFSELKHQGESVSSSTNSILLLCALVPSCFTVLASNPFARLVGYKTAVRISAVVFTISPFCINFWFNKWAFAIFWLMIPLSCFCLGAMPVINCLWTHFPRDLSKVSGIAVLMFSLGMIFWNLLFLFIVNPDNQKAVIDQNLIPIFPEYVAHNVYRASNIVYIIAGICNITGTFLISKKKELGLTEPLEERSALNRTEMLKVIQNQPIVEMERAVSQIGEVVQKVTTLQEGLKDKRFILVFFISALMPVYLIYLVLNIKLLYMPIINDDHFLSYCSALVTISAVIGAPLWGYIGDAKGFKFSLMMLVLFDCLVKLFGVFSSEKWSLLVLFFLLGVNDKGMLTIIGPGLIGMFGIQMATELVPYKGLAVFLAYVLAPLCQMSLSGVISHSDLLLVYFGLSVIGLFLSLYLNFRVKYKEIDPLKDEQQVAAQQMQVIMSQPQNKQIELH